MQKYGKTVSILYKQNNILKQFFAIFISFIMCVSCISPAYAHDREQHDEDIEYVLFGNRDYKKTHPLDANNIQAIEDAVYLCIDQYNGNGEKELKNLVENEKVPGIPTSINEFNYTSNYSHRSMTHRGWNESYDKEAHWPVRQQILRNTVRAKLFSSFSNPLLWLPKISEKAYGKNSFRQQCESFCILLYCIHVLGDHIEAGEEKDLGMGLTRTKTLKEKTTGLAYILPLSHTEDRDNPGLIPDLIHNCDILFKSQTNTRSYITFRQELVNLQEKSERLYNSTGNINTEEKFNDYNSCAHELLEILAMYVPNMLKKEEFFSNTFYK